MRGGLSVRQVSAAHLAAPSSSGAAVGAGEGSAPAEPPAVRANERTGRSDVD